MVEDECGDEEPFPTGSTRGVASNDRRYSHPTNGRLVVGQASAKLILDGVPGNQVGYRWNSMRPGKSLFPRWSDGVILEAIRQTIDEPQLVVRERGTTYRRREVTEVIIEVSSFDFRGVEVLSHVFPVNGTGVRYNPNPRDPKDNHLMEQIDLPLDRIELERYSRKHDRFPYR